MDYAGVDDDDEDAAGLGAVSSVIFSMAFIRGVGGGAGATLISIKLEASTE